MKNVFLILIIFSFSVPFLDAQSVGINDTGAPPNSGAILDVQSLNKGVLIPRTDTSSITSTTKGLLIYQIADERFYFYEGTHWVGLASVVEVGPFEKVGDLIRQKMNYDDDFLIGKADVPVNGQSISDKFLFFDNSKGALRAGQLINSANWSPDSIGLNSLAFGANSKAIGDASIALGGLIEAKGKGSFVAGYKSMAIGSFSTSIGRDNKSTQSYSNTFGRYLNTYSQYETVLGRYNEIYAPIDPEGWDDNDHLFVIGNGVSGVSRSNALTILKNGNSTINGQLTLSDGVNPFTFPTTDGQTGQAITTNGNGQLSWTDGDDLGAFVRDGNLIRQKSNFTTDDFILGRNGLPNNGEIVTDKMILFDRSKGAFLGGNFSNTTVTSPDSMGNGSFAFGQNNMAKGLYSVAFGQGSKAKGYVSSVLGFSSEALGAFSTAIGWSSKAKADYSVAIGKGAKSEGEQGVALGNYSSADGIKSIAVGSSSRATGDQSMAFGTDTRATSFMETVLGSNNQVTYPYSADTWDTLNRLFVVGNGVPNGTSSNALTILKNGNMKIGNGFPNARLDIDAPQSVDPLIVRVDLSPRLKVNSNGSLMLGTNTGSPASNVISFGDKLGVFTPNPQADIHIKSTFPKSAFLIEYNNNEQLKFDISGLIVSQNIKTPGIQDSDGSTRIQVEETDDDDKIRFDLGGYEKFVFDEQAGNPRIDLISDKSNTIIGNRAGLELLSTAERNTLIGEKAGKEITSGDFNVKIGYGAGATGNGSGNTYVGTDAGLLNHGSGNLAIGYQAGNGNTGNDNIFIGNGTGSQETGSNKLYIDNSIESQPLIYGDFGTDELEVNGDFTIDIPLGSAESNAELRFSYHDASKYSMRYNSTSDYFYIREDDTGDNVFYVEDGNVGIQRRPTTNDLEVGGTASKSSAGDWLANSDARLKKNMVPMDPDAMLHQMTKLQGLSYEWNDHREDQNRPEGVQYGFTAQNIQKVFPELVSEDSEGYLQTSYGTYDAMYVESIKALLAKIENLEQRLAGLETEFTASNK